MKTFLLVIKLEIIKVFSKRYEALTNHPKMIINEYKLFEDLKELNIELYFAHFHWEEAYKDTIVVSLYILIKDIKKRELLGVIEEMDGIKTQDLKLIEYKLLKLVSSGKMFELTNSGFKEIHLLPSGKYKISDH
jgi:hypothetical protein